MQVMNNTKQTIVAISTPLSSGAISIVRMSGENAISIASNVFKTKKGMLPSAFTPRMLMLGTFTASEFSEQALCAVFKAPNSFTGEDMVEFQCHGGVVITKGILAELVKQGAKLASPGEFTRRAFLNGKMALSDAEGMMDMINAQSEAEIRAGYNLLSGKLSKLAFKVLDELVDILSEIEVSFDYPEETIEYITKSNAKARLVEISNQIKAALDTASAGKIIKEGVSVAILGKPNVGKSSLLNAMLQDEKAIVTDIAGTTRDIIEGSITYKGLRFNFFDTAGIHETSDAVEKLGVDKAKNIINSADLVLFVKDSEQTEAEDQEVADLLKNKTYLTIINKSDKTGNYDITDNTIRISAKEKINIELLVDKIYSFFKKHNQASNSLVVANQRHIDLLSEALAHINSAIDALDSYTLDLATIDINLAYNALGDLTGNTSNEKVIDAIFSKFCLGK